MAMRIRRRINLDGPPIDLVEGQLGFNRPAAAPTGFTAPTDDLYIGIADTPANIRTLVSPARQVELTGAQTITGVKTIGAATDNTARLYFTAGGRNWTVGAGAAGHFGIYDTAVSPAYRIDIDADGLVIIAHDLVVGGAHATDDTGITVRAPADHQARANFVVAAGTNPGGSWGIRVGTNGNFAIVDDAATPPPRLNISPAGVISLNGQLILTADPTANLEAATKQYVDSQVGAGGGLPLTGGTLHNPTNDTTLTIHSDADHISRMFLSVAAGAGPNVGGDWNIAVGPQGHLAIRPDAALGLTPAYVFDAAPDGLVTIGHDLTVLGTLTASVDDGVY